VLGHADARARSAPPLVTAGHRATQPLDIAAPGVGTLLLPQSVGGCSRHSIQRAPRAWTQRRARQPAALAGNGGLQDDVARCRAG
jgi:hypothetical protein